MWGCAVAVWFFLVGVGDAAHPRTTAPKKILFIGNSMTYVGDLPKQVARLAAEHNFGAVVCDMEAPGGVTLKQHWESGKAQKMIQTGCDVEELAWVVPMLLLQPILTALMYFVINTQEV